MSKSLFLRETVWLWVGILLMAVVPQLSIFRVGPLSSFFLESGALLMALFFVLFTIFSGSLKELRIYEKDYYISTASGYLYSFGTANAKY